MTILSQGSIFRGNSDLVKFFEKIGFSEGNKQFQLLLVAKSVQGDSNLVHFSKEMINFSFQSLKNNFKATITQSRDAACHDILLCNAMIHHIRKCASIFLFTIIIWNQSIRLTHRYIQLSGYLVNCMACLPNYQLLLMFTGYCQCSSHGVRFGKLLGPVRSTEEKQMELLRDPVR